MDGCIRPHGFYSCCWRMRLEEIFIFYGRDWIKMNELTNMTKEIRKISLAFMLIATGVSTVVWQGSFSTIGMGIIIGTMSGLIGFAMINMMSSTIEYASDPKAKGNFSYVSRFFLYMIIFGLSAYRGVHLLALLVGMLCHKGAIVLYAYLHRKEVD